VSIFRSCHFTERLLKIVDGIAFFEAGHAALDHSRRLTGDHATSAYCSILLQKSKIERP
jgi:hypothetical protein